MVYAISFLLIRLLSRYRELAADRSGALLTGQPSALASALQKVSGDIATDPDQGPARGRAAERVLLRARASGQRQASSLSTLFSTHPSLERRLEQLAEISAAARQQVAGGVPRHAARPDQAGPAEPGRAVRAADRGDHAAGGDGPGPDRHRLGRASGPPRAGRSATSRRTSATCSTWATDAAPVELTTDSYGFTWLVCQHAADDVEALVTDLHAVNSSLEDGGFGPQLLCTLVGFRDDVRPPARHRLPVQAGHVLPVRAAWAASAGTTRWSCRCAARSGADLKIEPDLSRWFAVWGAPGL